MYDLRRLALALFLDIPHYLMYRTTSFPAVIEATEHETISLPALIILKAAYNRRNPLILPML